MNISKKALALFAGSAVAIGGVASIGAQAFAQTPAVAQTPAIQTVINTPSEATGLEKSTPEASGGPDVQIGHQDAPGTGSDATEVKGTETKDAPEAPGAPDVQSGHQDATGTDSTSAQ
ncbi:MAG: hypothetical protein ACYCZZ_01760 [Minisyncoccota bacterium]